MFGGSNHYDKNDKQIGYSAESLFGGANHYDSDGNQVCTSIPSLFSELVFYDATGHHSGYSIPNIIAGTTFFSDGDNAEALGSEPMEDDGYFDDDGFFGAFKERITVYDSLMLQAVLDYCWKQYKYVN